MNNFSERIKDALFNFAKNKNGFGEDDDEFELGTDESTLDIYKANLLKSKDTREYNDALRKVVSKHSDLQEVGADTDFKTKFKEIHGDDGEYDKLFGKDGYIQKSIKATELANKNSDSKLARDKAAMQATQDLGEAITDSMESPAKEFFAGMFKALMNAGVNIAKIKALKDDETGFDLEKELADATGNPNVVDDASEKSKVPVAGASTETPPSKPENKPAEGSTETPPSKPEDGSIESNTNEDSEGADSNYDPDSDPLELGENGNKSPKKEFMDKIFAPDYAELTSTDKKKIKNNYNKGKLSKSEAEKILEKFPSFRSLRDLVEGKTKNFSERIAISLCD